MVDAEIIQMNRLRKARAIAQCWRQLGYGANDLQQMVNQSGLFGSSGCTPQREAAREALSRLLTAASAIAGRRLSNRWDNASKATWDLAIDILKNQ
jgi:hypothetical protein